MRKIKILAAVMSVVALCGLLFTGCSVGTPTVNLNDYVTVTESGYEGYGSVHASIDFDKLLEDYADNLTDKSLDTQYFGNKTADLAAQFVFDQYDPYTLAYNAGNELKNGDKVEFSWNTSESGIEMLSKILEVKIKYDNFDHKMKDLKPLQEVDIFANVDVDTWGISGQGSVSDYPMAVVELEGVENPLHFELEVNTDRNGILKNGDTIEMVLEGEVDAEYYARNYGIILTRTSAEVELNSFAYYAYEKPEEVFEFLGGKGMENTLAAITEWVQVDGEERTVEFAGAIYYYQNEGNEYKDGGYNTHNQLLLIYHIDNGIVPGGWHTYLAPNNDVVIGYEQKEDGTMVKAAVLDVQKVMENNYMYYQKELYISFSSYEHPITFKHNDVTYVGHQTIEDCVKAYEANELKGRREFNNKVVSEELADIIK